MTQPTNQRARVSVVVKSYNHAPYIAQTIQSVLDQSFQDFELLITDDGSTDGTAAVAASFSDPRIDLKVLPGNEGISAAMNATIARASGEYIAILNSDDYAMPGRLERQVAFLEEHGDVDALFGLPHTIDENGKPTASYFDFTSALGLPDFSRASWLRRFFFVGNCLCAPTAMIRRAAYERVGQYDCRLTNLQDYDMWIRFVSMGFNIHVLAEELSAFRVRAASRNMSAPGRSDALLRVQFESAQVLKRYITLEPQVFRQAFANELDARGLRDDASQASALALMALTTEYPGHQLFALQTLFDEAAQTTDLRRLRELMGTVDVLGLSRINMLTNALAAEVRLSHSLLEAATPVHYAAMAHAREAFDEASYMARYPDVAAAVASGQFASGHEHWLRFGIKERRNFRSSGGR
jgi:glycosyltransferase involved in cell wall biosynthesis